MWETIESYTRTDANGYVHLVTRTEPDPDAGWVLRITGVAKDFDFLTAAEAQGFSQEWEAKITAERAEEAAEAAKWPKMGTKTLRRFSWDADNKVHLETKAYQPKFGTEKVAFYLDGEFLGHVEKDNKRHKDQYKAFEPGSDSERYRWRSSYATQADAIRRLIDTYEKKTGKFI